jgi:hypothetical protein
MTASLAALLIVLGFIGLTALGAVFVARKQGTGWK